MSSSPEPSPRLRAASVASDPHPLRPILEAAARGSFPPPDGSVTIMPAAGPMTAVVALTATHYVLADVDTAEVRARLDPEDLGAPLRPAFVTWLAERLGLRCGSVDVVMARTGIGGGSQSLHLVDAHDSRRVERARRYRNDIAIQVTPDKSGTVILGTGLVGRLEVSIELDPARRFSGDGRSLIVDALRAVEPHEAVFAQVAPGNAASLRAFLAAGFRPIGAEVLIVPAP